MSKRQHVVRHKKPGPDGGNSSPMPGLRYVRKSLGLSLAELAQRAGVAPSTLSRIEIGEAGASEPIQRAILSVVVIERRRQREAELERWERIQRAGVGPAHIPREERIEA